MVDRQQAILLVSKVDIDSEGKLESHLAPREPIELDLSTLPSIVARAMAEPLGC